MSLPQTIKSTRLIAIASCLLAAVTSVAAQTSPSRVPVLTHPQIMSESKHDMTPMPLREIRPVAPGPRQPPTIHHFINQSRLPYQLDSVVQIQANLPAAAIVGLNFEGLGVGLGGGSGDPPDANLSVGDTQVVQTINFLFAVFDKSSGNVVYGPAPLFTLWSGFGGPCENQGRGDPVVVFDKAAQRWIIAQLAGFLPTSFLPDNECVAVSQTSDATGSYYRYAFTLNPGLFVDYVKIGVWPDAYYLLNNSIDISGMIPKAPQLCALDRTQMLAGAPATGQCFFPDRIFSLLLPSDLDGSTPPPPGTPNYFLGPDQQSSTVLNLFKFHVDFSNPSNSTFTGPVQIPVQPYNNMNQLIPQPAVSNQVTPLTGTMMYRLAYRNFGDHESLVVNHTVDAGGGIAGIRWYEIRDPAATVPTVYQQGTFSPDLEHRWMGSIAMDRAGDIALGYSISSSSVFPSIAFTGRTPSDPLGLMQAETILFSGTGSQTGSLRWGDYTSMAIDPVDDCTFWYANEYLTQTGPPPVHTRIASLSFPGCTMRVTNQCVLGQGFWKSHLDAWPVSSLTLGSQTYTQSELLSLFDTPVKGDASLILAGQLIAAKLNIANGSNPTPINATITEADRLLNGFTGKLPYHVRPSSVTGKAMVDAATLLQSYNNGEMTPNCTP
jgi:hypothetical protein